MAFGCESGCDCGCVGVGVDVGVGVGVGVFQLEWSKECLVAAKKQLDASVSAKELDGTRGAPTASLSTANCRFKHPPTAALSTCVCDVLK